MIESLPIGRTTCDYLEPEEFLSRSKAWLEGNTLTHVVTLNPEMVMEAEKNNSFLSALRKADIRIPDGSGLIWARWYLRSKYWNLVPSLVGFLRQPAIRITGVDAVHKLSRIAHASGKSVYLLGGAAGQADRTAEYLRQQIPGITIHTATPHTFDISGPRHILDDIASKKPALLFVAYGSPKQTEWIEAHRSELDSVRIAVGVGGAFAILSEDTPRAPQLLQRLNLEWLWRLLLQPSRLPRIWNAVARFPKLIHTQKQQSNPA